uniref:Uncharacterized protein n=1 Tax=Ananas comosus var. bracteatus TaxID=296719 RepID=A0A6V7P4B4_ANACO|nr:unnamed protein product [Ananas comosus var. bracteatus]
MLSEARSLPCFQLVFDLATFDSSIGSVKLDLEYFKYSRSSLTEPIDDSKVARSKMSWKHGMLRTSDSIVASLLLWNSNNFDITLQNQNHYRNQLLQHLRNISKW